MRRMMKFETLIILLLRQVGNYIYKQAQAGFVVHLLHVPEKHNTDVVQNPHLTI
jgi:hypothetical protein